MFFNELLSSVSHNFHQPQERLFLPVLLFTLILCVFHTLFFRRRDFSQFKEAFLNWQIWSHPSSITDFKLLIFNNTLKFLYIYFFAQLFVFSDELPRFFLKVFNSNLPGFSYQIESSLALKVIFTLASFLTLDFARFFQHYLMHKIPFLWRYHQVHHSAEVLTPISLHRVHPLELLIGSFRSVLVISLVTAVFIFVFRAPVTGLDILGVNLFGFLFNALGANVRHSQYWMSFGWLEHIFISPAQHQIHHSVDPKHFNKNFGVSLSLWDRFFGSLYLSQQCESKSLKFGLDKKFSFRESLRF